MSRCDQFIPHLVVSDGMAALKFYQEVFGAETGDVMLEHQGTRLMHGEIILDGHMLFLSDEFSERQDLTTRTPQTLGGTTVRITLQTDDPDAVVERAVARRERADAGAENVLGLRVTERSSIRSDTSGASINSWKSKQRIRPTPQPRNSSPSSKARRDKASKTITDEEANHAEQQRLRNLERAGRKQS